ncbi:MAG: hypothetical protein COT91_02515 [Candidatus Doudnabacteria bacterium CG10_big_fil_rev_8_21_14_0_10_41_10]|uniref:Uncharacterized protein n=1 Tax=Candidatus Doudnabacteria bacterium CG10_big_fil_rev_8_21_14_0_10_41_10 TaxID=1974551 RepID=A0A2H0VDS0_9BACT|nr:MAG: hypothetical protein COT91_02515 [Candidatus Doudnabacteria bacterium CG10_big_fil_rev_8_21_14_0_10_41_10]
METSNGYSKFYIVVGKISGWLSIASFALGLFNKLSVREWLFTPSDLLQAALYLVLFAIFASMAAISSR